MTGSNYAFSFKPDLTFKPLSFGVAEPPGKVGSFCFGEEWSVHDEVGLDIDSLSITSEVKDVVSHSRKRVSPHWTDDFSVAEVSVSSEVATEANEAVGNSNRRWGGATTTAPPSAAAVAAAAAAAVAAASAADATFSHHPDSPFKSGAPLLFEMERGHKQGRMKRRRLDPRRVSLG